jgi:hypothetical protein
MYEEQTITIEQYNSLQALVGELLLTNQKLREQLAQLAQTLQTHRDGHSSTTTPRSLSC